MGEISPSSPPSPRHLAERAHPNLLPPLPVDGVGVGVARDARVATVVSRPLAVLAITRPEGKREGRSVCTIGRRKPRNRQSARGEDITTTPCSYFCVRVDLKQRCNPFTKNVVHNAAGSRFTNIQHDRHPLGVALKLVHKTEIGGMQGAR